MLNLTRKDFILMCGAGLTGVIGTAFTINQVRDNRPEYITNIEVNPDEFIILPNKDIYYIALGGCGLMQGEETNFVNELISKNIVPYDACDIHNLPKDGSTNIFTDTTISTIDGLNYTITSKDEALISSVQKYSSDILAKNSELFSEVQKTR